MTRLKVLISDTYNPWFNIATEDWILKEMDPQTQTLFLWRNEETVVIGRNQNPWSECHLQKMNEDGVHLARRTTGGGAVFHDLGNTNFTFLSPRAGYDRSANVNMILKTLAKFGVTAEASGRNDIIVPMPDGAKKISGSAYRETKDRCFHHGTLLINADLTRLGNYLTPHPKKLESKGRTSVRARVMNLSEITSALTHETFSKELIESFFEHHGARCEVEKLDPQNLQGVEKLKETFESFSSWDWRFGHAPNFHHEMTEYLSLGFIQVFVDAEKGQVTRAQVFSDALYPDLIADLQKSLIGKKYSHEGMTTAVSETLLNHPGQAAELAELETWLKTQVEV